MVEGDDESVRLWESVVDIDADVEDDCELERDPEMDPVLDRDDSLDSVEDILLELVSDIDGLVEADGEAELEGVTLCVGEMLHVTDSEIVWEGVEINEVVGVTFVNDVVLDGVRESELLAVPLRDDVRVDVGVGVGGGVMVCVMDDD